MGLMDLFGKKSPLFDCNKYLANIPGKLAGPPMMSADGDFSVNFVPDAPQYLNNRNNVKNPNGQMALKVKVIPQYRQSFQDAVTGMAGQPVFASGVLVNDDSQGGRAEIHPLDLLYAPIPPDHFPGWFKDIQNNLKDPGAVLAYRVVAASDASKSMKPPRAEETRPLKAFFPYPNKPNVPKIKIDFEIRKTANMKADLYLSNDLVHQKIQLDMTVASVKDEGPGLFTGVLVIYWGNE